MTQPIGIFGKIARILSSALQTARSRYAFTPLELALYDINLRRQAAPNVPDGAPLVVVQVVEDIFYSTLFAEIVAALRDKGPARTEQLVMRSLRVGSSLSAGAFVASWLNWNSFSDRKWIRFYRAFAGPVAYRTAALRAPWTEIGSWLQAHRIWRGLKDADQLVALQMRGIVVGDLIADSYLRFKPSAVLDLGDPYLLVVIHQALKDIDSGFAYFERNRPQLYLTSYSTYVQHGIAARVAAAAGAKVLSFATYQDFCKPVTLAHPSQEVVHQNYRTDFEKLSNPEEKRGQSAERLTARLTGRALDAQMGPMLTSAHSVQTTDVPDVKGAVVIFLHDFYDSPHIFAWMAFPDFWEWVCFTIDTLVGAGIPFFLKPHPNQLTMSTVEVDRLRAKYPDLKFISPKITNAQLAGAGIACAISVYGSVVSEMAFMGVPAITCGDNPHISFDFGRPARSREEYRTRLLSALDIATDPAEMKAQACAFYYMHNLNLDAEETAVRDKLVSTWRTYLGGEQNWEQAAAEFRQLPQTPGFSSFIEDLYTQIATRPGEQPQPQSHGQTECSRIPQS